MKKQLTVFGTLLVLGFAQIASADRCKDPDIKIINGKSVAIKVMALEYYDGCDKKWRSEGLKDETVNSGKSYTYHDDLEYVEGCKVSAFRVKYEELTTGSSWGAGKWTGELIPSESSVVCGTGKNYTITVE